MYYHSDHFEINNYCYQEYPPKFYLDFTYSKPNLRLRHISSKEFTIHLGVLNLHVNLHFKWGYVERPKTEMELQREKRVQEVLGKSR